MEGFLKALFDCCITVFNHRIPVRLNNVDYSFSLFNMFVFTTVAFIVLKILFSAFQKS